MTLFMCQDALHIVDFLGSCRMATAPTSIEVLLRPTQSQSDEPSDKFTWFSESHDMTSLHACPVAVVYTEPGSPRRSPIQLRTGRDVA